MAMRKLQQEIDKVMKKVKEGTAEFDYLYDKLLKSENPSQKEKLEGDLKKEIKKLQRSRDQIKTWMSGNEVKDKTQLAEMRKEIEADMEKFKDIEKEMKTKAFSKQGLNMQQKLDPREREKLEMGNFLQSQIEELELQSEGLEARIDALTNSKRKLTSKKQDELKDTQEKVERNTYHMTQLDTLLRLLENGDLETEDVAELKEDIEYYVNHNQEDLFVDDDAMYEALGLDSKEEYLAALEASEEANAAAAAAAAAAASSANTPPPEAQHQSPTPPGVVTPGTTSVPTVKRAVSNGALPSSVSASVPSAPLPKPVLNTAAAVAVGNGSTSASTSNNGSAHATPVKTTPTPKIKYSTLIAAEKAKENAAQAALQQQQQQQHQPTPVHPLSSLPASQSQSHTNGTSLPGLTRIATNTTVASSMTRESTQSPQAQTPISRRNTNTNIPELSNVHQLETCESIKDLLPALDEGCKKLLSPAAFEDISEILKSSLLTCPDSYDSDKRKIYHSEAPTRTFVYYPQEPLASLTNNTKNLTLFDDSTLFYIFYHHKAKDDEVPYHTTYGKYLQYASAEELTSRGWVYNLDSHQWYKKQAAAATPAAAAESGASLNGSSSSSSSWDIFDHENSWNNKKLENFDFNSISNNIWKS